MPAKTKTKKKQTKSKTAAAKPVKKPAVKKLATKKPATKVIAKKKTVKAQARAQKKSTVKKIAVKGSTKAKGRTREARQTPEPPAFSVEKRRNPSGRQAGDLQGLSLMAGADSESVAELVEEGNPFEAEVVLGVEGAGQDDGEVRTHQTPEDDVPEEYLDRD